MKLPTHEFAEVIECLIGPKDAAGANEKRRATRYTVSAKLDVYLLDKGKPTRIFSVLLRDISMTGAGLLQTVALPENQMLVVALPRRRGPLLVEAIAMNCRLLADGLLAVGADFTKVLKEQDANDLLGLQLAERARVQKSIIG